VRTHIGIISAPGRGHLYPHVVLAKHLIQLGFKVTFFDRAISGPFFRTVQLRMVALDEFVEKQSVCSIPETNTFELSTIGVLHRHVSLVLANARNILAREGIEALLVDQVDLASGTVAENLGIPFLNVSTSPPVFLDDNSPPFIFPWKLGTTTHDAKLRNRRGNLILSRIVKRMLVTVNHNRRDWGLSEFLTVNDAFSPTGIITQLPQIMDFPRPFNPPPIFYAGPFCDHSIRRKVSFPWERLNGKPVIFASMGTVRCESKLVFDEIIAVCAEVDCQLVLSLGGGSLTPDDFQTIPDNTIVVHFAPQLELLRLASLCISHGGMNTVLESIMCGVPMILIPVTDDQPGVAARVEWLGAGLSIPLRALSHAVLRKRIQMVLSDSYFQVAAKDLQRKIACTNGARLAAEFIAKRL
jgi:zeaxanthin glucosyltransferase